MKKLFIGLMILGLTFSLAYAKTETESRYAGSSVIYGYDGASIQQVETDSAGQLQVNVVPAVSTSKIIDAVTLDDSPTSTVSSNIAGGDYNKIVVYLYLDETDSGNDTSGAVSVDISYDDSTWIEDIGFYNVTDPTSNVTSVATNSGANTDENVAIAIDNSLLAAPYIRVQVTGTGTAAGGDDEITVNGYLATAK